MAVTTLGVLAWLAEDAWRFQGHLTGEHATPAIAASRAASVEQPIDLATVASFLGVQQQVGGNNTAPATPLTLLACLVERTQELSRALIQSPDTAAFYHPGDSLPGGGTLVSVSAEDVVILRNGRRQALTFATPANALFIAVPPAGSSPVTATSPLPYPTTENPL